MRINYSDFFKALGFNGLLYDAGKNSFDSDAISDRIQEIQNRWRSKYPGADFKIQNLQFDNLVNFNHSFVTELEYLNLGA